MANVETKKEVKKETTKEAKERIRKELAELVAKEKAEKAELRAIGIVGFYGRVPSVIDELRRSAKETPGAVLSVDTIAKGAERFFVASNPDRKVSANSSRLYTGEILEAFRLVSLVSLDTSKKEESYRLSPSLVGLLTAKK